MENNLICLCYVLQRMDNGFVEPTIYLNRPPVTDRLIKTHMFFNPFEAKKCITQTMGDAIVIKINKDRHLKLVENYG